MQNGGGNSTALFSGGSVIFPLVLLLSIAATLQAESSDSSHQVAEHRQLIEGSRSSSPCSGGQANGFPCNKIDLLAQIPLTQFSTAPTSANDIWGFVDKNDNREYAIIGLANGTAVVDVTDPVNPVEVGIVAGLDTLWRDVKVYQFFNNAQGRWNAFAYVTADGLPNFIQQLQILDLTNLPNSVSLAGTFNGFDKAHNILLSNIDYSTGEALPGFTVFAYILGAQPGGGAFRILDLSNPVAPVEITPPPPNAGYSHDAATMIVTGARTSACAAGHDPCEILVDYNEDAVDIWDVTDKSAPVLVSSATYTNLGYVHSGWPSDDTLFVTIQDELDERDFGLNTTLRTLDVSDLAAPFVSNIWTGPTTAIDHNGFFLGDLYFMSNYFRGLVLFDFSEPNNPREIAFFDTVPASDDFGFGGNWGVYPYLPSGTILVSDLGTGLFLLKAVSNPAPVLTALSPTSTTAGAGDDTLLVFGSSFDPTSLVRWNGTSRPTTFVSSTELQAMIPASDFSAGGTADVTVFTPAPGGGTTPSLTFTITSFTTSASPSSVTVSAGQSATYTVTVTPEFGSFDPTVSLSCSNLPSLASCSFNPSQVTPGANPASTSLTISTTASSARVAPPFGLPPRTPVGVLWLGVLALALLGLTLARRAARRQLRFGLALGLLAWLLVVQVACGGGGETTPSAPLRRPGTPTGTFTITITGTAGSLQHSTTATLVVQ